MSDQPTGTDADKVTRRPPPPDMNPKTVTGYHVETDSAGKTHITLTLRKGGTVPLHDLDPLQALLYLQLLRTSGPQILAIWVPESNRLQWRIGTRADDTGSGVDVGS